MALCVTYEDRAFAIVGGTLLERGLEAAVLRKFVDLKKSDYRALFEGTAPLSSFSAKIKIAHALGVLNDGCKKDLEVIKDIRNAFAHSIAEIDFATPDIAKFCKRIRFPKQLQSIEGFDGLGFEIETPKGVFHMAVMLYSALLLSKPSQPCSPSDKAVQ